MLVADLEAMVEDDAPQPTHAPPTGGPLPQGTRPVTTGRALRGGG